MIYLLLIAFSVSLHVNSYAATYFVAKTGSNNNSCSQAQSQTTPRLTIASGISCLAAGDTLMIGAGTYSEGISGDSIANGASWSNTTKIKGAGVASTRITIPSGGHGISFFNAKQYIEFSDFELDGNNNVGHNGINIDGSAHHLRFRNIRIHHVKNQGIFALDQARFLEFYGIESSHAGANGSCYKSGGYCHGVYIDANDIVMDGCSLHHNNGLGVQWYPNVSNLIMRNCVVYNNTGLAGIWIGGGSNNVKIYNNTIYGNSNYGIAGDVNSSVEFRNNIAYNNGTNINCGSAVCTNNLTSNPSFVDVANGNFRLQAGSPAIDAGVSLGSIVPTDTNGVLRPQGSGVDIGAYEFGGSSGSQLTPPSNLQVTAN
jgi:hypothetical protein